VGLIFWLQTLIHTNLLRLVPEGVSKEPQCDAYSSLTPRLTDDKSI
jgi:hypothetical protein